MYARRSLLALGLLSFNPILTAEETIGQWAAGGQLEEERSGHTVTHLADGRVLIAGGENSAGLVAQTEVFDPAMGSSEPSGVLASPRKHHAAVLLVDGRVLLVGGEGPNGPLDTAELLDLRTKSPFVLSSLNKARSHHTTTRLPDGSVLVAGGQGAGATLASLEHFDPAKGTFELLAVALSTPRERHTATLLSDGRVLLAGGRNGLDAVATTEYFHPQERSLSAGPALAEARYGHTAAELMTGAVALIGGTDGATVRDSVELLSPDGQLATSPHRLLIPRYDHVALRLPYNEHLLIVGGRSASGPISSVELFDPLTYELTLTGSLLNARADSGALTDRGRAWVFAGNGSDELPQTGVEIYLYPTLTTDQLDYPPESVVTFLGSGWFPGETVQIQVRPSDGDSDTVLTAVADERGHFANTDFSTKADDTGVSFTVAATGASSAAVAYTLFLDSHLGIFSTSFGLDREHPVTTLILKGPRYQYVSGDPALQIPEGPSQVELAARDLAVGVPPSGVGFIGYWIDGPVSLQTAIPYTGPFQVADGLHAISYFSIDRVGNFEPIKSTVVRAVSDATPPVITPTVLGTQGNEGWYTSDVAVSWQVMDPESPISSTSGCGTTSVVADTATVTFTCTATSAGGTSIKSVTIKRDATAPELVFGSPSPIPNAEGWINTDVTIPFTPTDNVAGVASTSPLSPLLLTAEGVGITAAATVVDNAGNSATFVSPAFNIDKTPPTLSFGAPSPSPNEAGWNNTDVLFPFTAADPVSGVASTDPPSPLVLSAQGTAVTGDVLVTDRAGNRATFASPPAKIDKTSPTISASRSPDPNSHGWNNTDVLVSFSCADSLSGVAPGGAPPELVLSMEGADQSVTGACSDLAGNSALAAVAGINIDKTPPSIAVSQSPQPNSSGWNNSDVVVSFSATDALSGVSAVSAPVEVVAEGAGQVVTGTATDRAGNSASTSVTLNIDKTPPALSGLPAPGCTLWPPNHRLVPVATVTVSDVLSGLAQGSLTVTAASNEPQDGTGDGDSAPDIVVNGGLVHVRAERSANGTGRTYSLSAGAADQAGNATRQTAICEVPHDERR